MGWRGERRWGRGVVLGEGSGLLQVGLLRHYLMMPNILNSIL